MKFSSPSAIFALSFLFSNSGASPLPYAVDSNYASDPRGVSTSHYSSSDPSSSYSYGTSKYTPASTSTISGVPTSYHYDPYGPDADASTGSAQIHRSLTERNLDNNDHAAAIIFETLLGVGGAYFVANYVGPKITKRYQEYKQRKAGFKPLPGSNTDARDLNPEEESAVRQIGKDSQRGFRAYLGQLGTRVTTSVKNGVNRFKSNSPDVAKLEARVKEAQAKFVKAEKELDEAQKQFEDTVKRANEAELNYRAVASTPEADPAKTSQALKEWQDSTKARMKARTLIAKLDPVYESADAALNRAQVDLDIVTSREASKVSSGQPGNKEVVEDTPAPNEKVAEKADTPNPNGKDTEKPDTGKKGNDGQSIKIEGIPAGSVDEVVEKVAQNNQKAEAFAEVTRGGKAL